MPLKEILLTNEEQDECVPSEKQLEAYLAEPDDKTAASLSMSEKRLIAKCVLYGENIGKAQLKKIMDKIEADMPSITRYAALQYIRDLWHALRDEVINATK